MNQKIRVGIDHIDKLDFLAAYQIAHTNAFQTKTIQNSFKAAGLVPLNAESLLSKLNISLRLLARSLVKSYNINPSA